VSSFGADGRSGAVLRVLGPDDDPLAKFGPFDAPNTDDDPGRGPLAALRRFREAVHRLLRRLSRGGHPTDRAQPPGQPRRRQRFGDATRGPLDLRVASVTGRRASGGVGPRPGAGLVIGFTVGDADPRYVGLTGTTHLPAASDQYDSTMTPSTTPVFPQMSAISHQPSWLHVPSTPRNPLPSGSVAASTISCDMITVSPSMVPGFVNHA